jgi:Flp pilus assembly protein TadD
MKKIIMMLCVLCAFVGNSLAQKQKESKAAMEKRIEEAFKKSGMSKGDMQKVKEMMKANDAKPASERPVNMDEIFKNNVQLVPARNDVKINAIPKNIPTETDIKSTVNDMYNKLLAKGNVQEMAVAKKAMTLANTCFSLMDASVMAMTNGHPNAALLLALKSVLTAPNNNVALNNLAALLTQYGYPEKAIPFLNKILSEEKGNSTVLNNLAYAWLGLGATDMAYQYAYSCVMRNPNHPEARLCGGMILEKEGKKEDAEKQFEQTIKINNTAVSQQFAKNNKGTATAIQPTLSWDDIKRKISVYEYFPRGWRRTYKPRQKTLAYNQQFYADFTADRDMRHKFSKKLKELIAAKEKLFDLQEKDAGAMMKMDYQTLQFSVMASQVFGAIIMARVELQKKWKDKFDELGKQMNEIQTRELTGLKNKKLNCADTKEIVDPQWQQRMDEYNPKLIAALDSLDEDMRLYENAYLTWLLMSSNSITRYQNEAAFYKEVEEFGGDQSEHFNIWWEYLHIPPMDCKEGGAAIPPLPVPVLPDLAIPNLDCPAVVYIPSGFGNLSMGSSGFSASDNAYGITKSGSNRSPNMSVSYSIPANRISEPSIKKDPYINIANGTVDAAIGNVNDEDLVPLTKKVDDEELVPLTKMPKPSKVKPSWKDDDEELVPLISKSESKSIKNKAIKKERNAIRKILDGSITVACDNVTQRKKDSDQRFKELSEKLLEEVNREEAFEQNEAFEKKYPNFKEGSKKLDEQEDAEIKEKYKNYKDAIKEVEKNKGFTPTLNNGPSITSQIIGFIQGLF